MGCNCGGGGSTPSSSTAYQVKLPDGTTKTYRTEPEAVAAAKRYGVTYRKV